MDEAWKRKGENLAAEITASTDQRRAELLNVISELSSRSGGAEFIKSIGERLCEVSPDLVRQMHDAELKLVAALAELALREILASDVLRKIESARI